MVKNCTGRRWRTRPFALLVKRAFPLPETRPSLLLIAKELRRLALTHTAVCAVGQTAVSPT
ncbi:MAG: hypothetical protein IPM39_27460 [Chloroflexi bacterium]|nr:hypothetical protein [Chloroflexota bacterium]